MADADSLIIRLQDEDTGTSPESSDPNNIEIGRIVTKMSEVFFKEWSEEISGTPVDEAVEAPSSAQTPVSAAVAQNSPPPVSPTSGVSEKISVDIEALGKSFERSMSQLIDFLSKSAPNLNTLDVEGLNTPQSVSAQSSADIEAAIAAVTEASFAPPKLLHPPLPDWYTNQFKTITQRLDYVPLSGPDTEMSFPAPPEAPTPPGGAGGGGGGSGAGSTGGSGGESWFEWLRKILSNLVTAAGDIARPVFAGGFSGIFKYISDRTVAAWDMFNFALANPLDAMKATLDWSKSMYSTYAPAIADIIKNSISAIGSYVSKIPSFTSAGLSAIAKYVSIGAGFLTTSISKMIVSAAVPVASIVAALTAANIAVNMINARFEEAAKRLGDFMPKLAASRAIFEANLQVSRLNRSRGTMDETFSRWQDSMGRISIARESTTDNLTAIAMDALAPIVRAIALVAETGASMVSMFKRFWDWLMEFAGSIQKGIFDTVVEPIARLLLQIYNAIPGIADLDIDDKIDALRLLGTGEKGKLEFAGDPFLNAFMFGEPLPAAGEEKKKGR